MLESERQNSESADDRNESADQNGGTGRGLLRRARRAVTRPAGPPVAEAEPGSSPVAQTASAAPQAATAASAKAEAGRAQAGRPETPQPSAAVGQAHAAPAHAGQAGSAEAGGAGQPGAAPATTSRSRSPRSRVAKTSPDSAEKTGSDGAAVAGAGGEQPGSAAEQDTRGAVAAADSGRSERPARAARSRRTASAPEAAAPDTAAPDAATPDQEQEPARGTGTARARGSRRVQTPAGEAAPAPAGEAAAGEGPAKAGARRRGRSGQPAGDDGGERSIWIHPVVTEPPAAPEPQSELPATAFQPPLVIFQAPAITEARPAAPAPKPARPQPADAASADEEPDEPDESTDEASGPGGTKRRRRGGRGRGKGRDGMSEGTDAEGEAGGREPAGAAAADDDSDDDGSDDTSASGRRRRRRRRSGGGGGDSEHQAGDGTGDDPPNTVVHVRSPRAVADSDVRAVKGSTRLEAKRQRRREGRESGRRRPPIITESEFLARREAVDRVMVVRQHGDRTQIAVLEDGVLVEHYVDKASHQSYVGNVYLGKVQNVLPSMEAAFVDIGKGRNAVLYAGEVNFDASGLEGESKRIESALKSGQSILVQVTKDPIGHKGARLTSQVSLPGRYLVYVPGASMTGISRKLPDTERTRLKQILKQVMPENAGVIVRTAAEGASEEELARDVARLSAQWEAIEKKAKTASAPDLLYSEPDLTLRVVRDIFNEDFKDLVIASESEWDLVDEYVRYVAPHLADRMQRWDDAEDVFAAYRIDEQLAKALERKVWLPSGGSLVIDHTEAMTVIDVNTGKFTGQGGNLEQTVTRNNLEAAEEIVRQLRLRDLGGIIVIDFIDMVLESNRELVLRRLLECLARDRTKHQVAEVTSLGLVQMTRKRVGSGLLEAFSVACEHCNGRGVLVSMEPVDHAPRPRSEDGHGRENGRGGSRDHGSGRNGAGHGAGKGSPGRGGQGKGAASKGGRANGAGAGDPDPATAEPGTGAASVAQPDASPADPGTAAPAGTAGVRPRSSRSRSGRASRAAGPASPEDADAGSPAGGGVAVAEAEPADAGDGEAAATAAGSGRSRSGRSRRSGAGRGSSADHGNSPESAGQQEGSANS
jgi:ribonuclease E